MKRASLLVLILAIVAALAPATAFAQGPSPFGSNGYPFFPTGPQVIYDSTVTPLPAALPSVGPEAYAFNEFGDEVSFAGSNRNLATVTVTLASGACEQGSGLNSSCSTTPGDTYSMPITFNIYNVSGDTLGSQITTLTQTFDIPYRPSADTVHCTDGKWYDSTGGKCHSAIDANITFDFSAQGVTLPDTVVYSIQYSTTQFGPSPHGFGAACYPTDIYSQPGCFYDSLNIALSPAVVVGSKPYPDTVWWDTIYSYNYCDGGATGTFRLDSPGGGSNACWGGYVPAVQFTATGGPFSWAWNWWQEHAPFLFHNFN